MPSTIARSTRETRFSASGSPTHAESTFRRLLRALPRCKYRRSRSLGLDPTRLESPRVTMS
eukprot:30628-Pelagococcus_subviridis.AAC.6